MNSGTDMLQRIIDIVSLGVRSPEDKELMAGSLFYYCCGKDPSPVFAFGGDFALYVYSDIVDFGAGQLYTAVDALNARIEQRGYKLSFMKYVNNRTALMQWETRDGQCFHVLYIKGDSAETYSSLYSALDAGGNQNCLIPKCICNFRSELPYEFSTMQKAEKRVSMILGYSYSDNYAPVAQYEYFGDYGDKTITLFKRRWYYVF